MTRAGVMPGGDAVCHGYHVWDGDECVRCGFVDQVGRLLATAMALEDAEREERSAAPGEAG